MTQIPAKTAFDADHAAQLRHAVNETRIVFESEPAAGQALDYMIAVLDAAAAGGGNASVAEESLASAGAEPVAGAGYAIENDLLRQAAEMALALAEQQIQNGEMTVNAYRSMRSSFMDLARRFDQQAAHVESLTAALAGALAQTSAEPALVVEVDVTKIASVTPSAAEQAAAAMRTESAQLLIQAEKSGARAVRAAVTGVIDPLAVLSREVFSLSNKLQQPADLVVQLMVLSELKSQKKFT